MKASIGTASLTRSRWIVASALSVALTAYGLAVVPAANGAQPAKHAAAKVAAQSSAPAAKLHRAATLLDPAASPCTLSVSGTDRTCELYARKSVGAVTWPSAPDVAGVPFWSYTSNATDPVGATGPTLVVNEGETVHLNLHNALGGTDITALSVPQVTGLDADITGIADGATKDYSFVASRPGTFIYQAGGVPDAARQAAMGMVGALVVLPSAPADALTAYGAGTGSDYTDDSVVLLTDVDPAFNIDPVNYDMRNYLPQLHLLNGAPYPATSNITATQGGKELLRIVNGGIIQHALGVLGTNQTVVGESSRVLTHPYGVAVEKISAGDTLDMVVNVPAATDAGPLFPIYDSSSRLDNSSGPIRGVAPFGGALAFIDNGASLGTNNGPTVTDLAVGQPTIGTANTLDFTAKAGDVGQPDVTGIEYVIDDGSAAGGTGSSAGVVVTPGTGPVPVTGSLPASSDLSSVLHGLSTGSHTLLVRANSALGWGPFASIGFTFDNVGPTTSLVLDPTVTSAGALTISGTSSDTSSGGSGITGADAYIDGVYAGPLTLTPNGDVTVSVDGSISASKIASLTPEGEHTLTAKATDSLGNVGPVSDGVKFIVDRTGPVVSAVYVNPSPNNGSQGSANDPTNVEVRAWVTDDGPANANGKTSGVVDGEAFLGASSGANGAGFPLFPYTPAGTTSTVLVGYIPVSELTKYTLGQTVPIAVHARDAAGNWGTTFKVGSLVMSADLIFSSDFDLIPGLVPPWARFAQAVGSGLVGSSGITTGTNHAFVVARSAAADTNGALSFLVDASPSAETSYNVAFDFTAPNFKAGTSSGNARLFTIFQARNAAGLTAYSVEFHAWKPTTPSNAAIVQEVRLRVRTGTKNASTPSPYFRLTGTAPVTIHVAWTSSTTARPSIRVGTSSFTMSAQDTSARVVDTALFGVSGISGTIGSTGAIPAIGALWFDNFKSARVTKP
jgi:FtsP/CotA-like multicopper oxidase with cupredoxin domain